MNKTGAALIAGALTCLGVTPAQAGTVQCNSTSHTCTFTGKLAGVVASDGGGVVLYFDAAISVNTMQNAGLNVTRGDAGLVTPSSSDPHREAYKDKLFAIGTTAVAAGRDVYMVLETGFGEFPYISQIKLN